MSQLNIDTLRAKTAGVETPAIYPVRGSAKVWINFTGITMGIRASLNVASLTDNGVGDYTINLTTQMSSTQYMMISSGGNAESPGNAIKTLTTKTLNASGPRMVNLIETGSIQDFDFEQAMGMGYLV